jgi:quercetin dioxygenase-like cupin family protein
MTAEKAKPRDFDHTFKATYDRDVEWEEGAANELLTLPKGVMVKIFAHDPAMKRIDMKVKFPPGYVEPEHSHKSWHSIVVLRGRMCVAGKDLRPGDYVFGWDELHGPYEYPDGCEVFIVFMGEGTQHVWDADKHNAHEKVWTPESDAGREAAE